MKTQKKFSYSFKLLIAVFSTISFLAFGWYWLKQTDLEIFARADAEAMQVLSSEDATLQVQIYDRPIGGELVRSYDIDKSELKTKHGLLSIELTEYSRNLLSLIHI